MSNYFPAARSEEVARLQRGALLVGVVALVACAIGAFFDPTQFFRAYLAAYQLYLGIGLGSLVLVMVYHLTGGAWGFLIRRILEAATRTLPLLALLFIPIACGAVYLYPWARPEEVAASKDLRHKQIYLNLPFFWGRAALFFVLWLALAFVLDAWSRQQDQTGDERLPGRFGLLSGAGLPAYGLSITFASVDWVMSLEPTFRSTTFGPLYASGQILSAHAFALVVMAWLVARPPLANYLSVEALNDLGNLLLTFVVIWSYMEWFQFMLIWIANLPWEVAWYLARSRNGWQWVAWALFVFHFAVPYPLAPGPSTALPAEPRLEQIDRLEGVERPNVYKREEAKEGVLNRYGPTAEQGYIHGVNDVRRDHLVSQPGLDHRAPRGPVADVPGRRLRRRRAAGGGAADLLLGPLPPPPRPASPPTGSAPRG
jgi:hypothetical protein